MRRIVHLGAVMFLGALASAASAGPIVDPAATIDATDLGGGVFDYKVTLSNSGASPAPIGTFWFAWVPGKDFLDSAPLSVMSPTGWTDHVTNTGADDGFAIQWVANSAGNALAPGQSLSFEFTSTETPQQLAKASPFFPAFLEGTSFVYSGAPFSDSGTQFVATPSTPAPPVPEPSSLALLLTGVLCGLARQGLKSRRKPSQSNARKLAHQ